MLFGPHHLILKLYYRHPTIGLSFSAHQSSERVGRFVEKWTGHIWVAQIASTVALRDQINFAEVLLLIPFTF
jgi:hypothetical protein